MWTMQEGLHLASKSDPWLLVMHPRLQPHIMLGQHLLSNSWCTGAGLLLIKPTRQMAHSPLQQLLLWAAMIVTQLSIVRNTARCMVMHVGWEMRLCVATQERQLSFAPLGACVYFSKAKGSPSQHPPPAACNVDRSVHRTCQALQMGDVSREHWHNSLVQACLNIVFEVQGSSDCPKIHPCDVQHLLIFQKPCCFKEALKESECILIVLLPVT